MQVKSLPTKDAYRVLLEFQLTAGPIVEESLTIENRHHEYTDEYRELARDFYLAF